jgi:hypothetical protein
MIDRKIEKLKDEWKYGLINRWIDGPMKEWKKD